MTAKEKAKQLYSKYYTPLLLYKDGLNIKELKLMQKCAKDCSLISVEEKYNSLRVMLYELRAAGLIAKDNVYLKRIEDLINEELEVKQEIEKL